MTHLTTRLATFAAAAAVALAATAGTAAAQREARTERFRALAVQPAGLGAPTTLMVELAITRWSTDAEQQKLRTTLLEQPKNVLEVLSKMPEVGRIETPGNVGYALRYAQKTSTNGTDQILLLTDRPVGFAEAANSGRTLDYPITVIQLQMQPSGKGEGKIAVAARLIPNRLGKEIMVEDWNFTPVTLQGVERMK
jgi:hypothetical protein